MNIEACLSHNHDNWKTPTELYDYFVNKLHCIDMFEYCSQFDQYEKIYNNQLLFCNPPYSHLRTKKFIDYMVSLLIRFNRILLLIPVRTDTQYFTSLYPFIEKIYFFKGRLHFNDSKCAPFPSMLLSLDISALFATKTFQIISVKDFIERGVDYGVAYPKK